MLTRFIPRLLVTSLLLAIALSGTFHLRGLGAERTQWTDSVNAEDALVEACDGFNITGSYSADRAFQVVENYDGSKFYERQDVTFAGALGDATAGKSYAYDGQFTRIESPNIGKVRFSNLKLRFEVDTPGQFTYSLDKVDFKLSDDPHQIVKTIVSDALQMDICQLFGGSSIGSGPIPSSSHPPAISAPTRSINSVHTENMALPQAANVHTENSALGTSTQAADASDNMTPWTELDPCDTSPPGQPC